MNNSVNPTTVIGLDIGSSYIKAVSLNPDNTINQHHLTKTSYNYTATLPGLLKQFNINSSLVSSPDSSPDSSPVSSPVGVTGYGRYQWNGVIQKTEISALAMGLRCAGIHDGTLIDIGGQDSKVLKLKNGKLVDHALNKRCAAGTGSYLEFIAFRMGLDIAAMTRLASQDRDSGLHPLNSFCTVFASTEILDCTKKNIPLPKLIRGLYASIAERIREIASLDPPVYISGGLIAHHPALLDIFNISLGTEIKVVPHPQFLAALGIAAYARQETGKPKGDHS